MKPKNRIESLMSGVQKRKDDMKAEHRKKVEQYEAEIASMPIRDEELGKWLKAMAEVREAVKTEDGLIKLVLSIAFQAVFEGLTNKDVDFAVKLHISTFKKMKACGLNEKECREILLAIKKGPAV